jgi:hypothetical protein
VIATDVTKIEAAERWFIGKGVPTLIHGYSFRAHVLPRALSFLTAVGLAVLTVALGNSSEYALWILLAAVAVWFVLRRGRRSGRRVIARTATGIMVVIAVSWPVVAPLLVAVTQPPLEIATFLPESEQESWANYVANPPVSRVDVLIEASLAAWFLTLNWMLWTMAAILATWFGIVRLARRAVAGAFWNVYDVWNLQGRTLPAMVFLTLFLIVNEDVWKASADLTPARLTVTLLLFAGVALLATAAKLREERDTLLAQLQSTTTGAREPETAWVLASPVLPHLTWSQKINISLALGARQFAQALWVGVGVFLFLVILGMLVVSGDTAAEWLSSSTGDTGDGRTGEPQPGFLGVPLALVHAAVLLGGFAAMYFTVMSMTDAAFRERHYMPTVQELRQILHIHGRYWSHLGSPAQPSRRLSRLGSNTRATLRDLRERWQDRQQRHHGGIDPTAPFADDIVDNQPRPPSHP